MQVYQTNDFWDKFYIKFIESVCIYRHIDINVDELEDFIIDKEFLNPDEVGIFGEHIKNVVNMLEYFREIVLKGVELGKSKHPWPWISDEEMENLYLKLDPSGQYLPFFRDDSELSFKAAYHRICAETEFTQELFQLCVETAHSYIEFHILKPFGEITFEYAWLTLQAPFIFKEFGVLLFHDDYDIGHLLSFTSFLIERCSKIDPSEWDTLPEFNRICRGFETMSENWSLRQEREQKLLG